MSAPTVRQIIDSSPISRFQRWVVFLCVLMSIADGFDALAIGYLLPAISKDWGVPPGEFGFAITMGLVGMLVGSTTLGPLADRVGRRAVMIAGTLIYASLTGVITLLNSVELLGLVRFFAGIGLGAVLPTLIVMAGEFMPSRAKGRTIVIVTAGTTGGGFICGLVARWMVPSFGWESVYLVGAFVPLVLAAIAWCVMPESLIFMAARGRTKEVRRQLERMDQRFATADIDFSDAKPQEKTPRIPVGRLLGPGWRLNTILLWISWFMALIAMYFLYSWLPTLLTEVGVAQETAILAMTLVLFAGLIGGLVQGWIVDRRGDYKSVTIGLPLSVVLILLVSVVLNQSVLLVVFLCLFGFTLVGTNQALFALTSALYPAEVRVTGIGWGVGAGRVGSLVAPLVGGLLITRGVPGELILQLVAIPTLVGAITVAVLVARVSRAQRMSEEDPVTPDTTLVRE